MRLSSYTKYILNSAERAAKLTSALLAFSRKQMINLQPLNLNEIVKGLERLLMQFIGEDMIDHTPKDEVIKLYLGDAFDVIGERKKIDYRK